MLRLCSDSSRSYPGRSARHGGVLTCLGKVPVRHLVDQAWAHPLAADGCERMRQQRTGRSTAHSGAIHGVTEQKSAEAIVAQRPG